MTSPDVSQSGRFKTAEQRYQLLLERCRRLSETLDVQTVLQEVVDSVTKLVGLDTAAVYLLEDDEHLHLWATTPPIPPAFPEEMRIAPLLDHPHIADTLKGSEPLFISDWFDRELTEAEHAIASARNLRTQLFVPLMLEAEPMGIFIVGSVGEPVELAADDIDLAVTFAGLSALAIRNAKLYEKSRKNAEELAASLAERIRMEEERAKLEAQLLHSQKMESVGRLAGGVAHDFNNMLSVILGHAEMALRRSHVDKKLYSDLLQIQNAAEKSADLTRQLLAFARKQNAKPSVIDVNQVIGDMLKMLTRLMGEGIEINWRPGEGIGFVKIDPAQVDQIMANLCLNARDAIGGTGQITIETSDVEFDHVYCKNRQDVVEGKYVMVSVTDDGVGMDAKTKANIFEPYFSTKPADKGTGLGLSTVYGIVKQNSGFINVYSELGQGTTFKVYLRMDESGAASQARKSTEEQVLQEGSGTILFVEDEAMILELGKEMLESFGYTVLPANNPKEALEIARDSAESIDLLMTDIVMPHMNGHELARQVEAFAPHLKVLYISGYTANAIADQGLLQDGILLLSKPFSMAQLATKVSEAMGRE